MTTRTPDRRSSRHTSRRFNPDRLTSEAALIGAAMVYQQHAAEVLGDLGPDDLTSGSLAYVLGAVRTLLAEGTPPEPALVAAWLARRAVRPPAGTTWPVVVADTLAYATVPAAAPAHRRAVLEARYRREAADLGRTLTGAAVDDPDDQGDDSHSGARPGSGAAPLDELMHYVRDGTARLARTRHRLTVVQPTAVQPAVQPVTTIGAAA